MSKASDPEHIRLHEDEKRQANWKRWGPYLSERQWGTVREVHQRFSALIFLYECSII
jgi:hypothetical protein